jgi:RNA polymerase sigma factor (sigma-70 family)
MAHTYSTRKTLLQRVRNQHDEKSWAELVEVYRRYIYSVIRSLEVSEHDADDIIQQVFIKLWDKLPGMDPSEIIRFRSLLARITKGCTIDFIRKRSTQAEKLKEAARDETLNYLNAIQLPEIDQIAEQRWELFLSNMALDNVESQCSAKAISVFRMSLNGISAQEISDELELEISSVYRLKTRVKNQLIQEIEHLRKELE